MSFYLFKLDYFSLCSTIGAKCFFLYFWIFAPFWVRVKLDQITWIYLPTLHTHLCVYHDPLPTTENNSFEQKVCANAKQKLLFWCISFELTTAVSTEHTQECIEDARKSAAYKKPDFWEVKIQIFFLSFSRVSELRFNFYMKCLNLINKLLKDT